MKIGVLGMLGVLFVGLKLAGVIAWSWWLVLLPFYGVIVFVIALGCGAFVIAAFIDFTSWVKRRVR